MTNGGDSVAKGRGLVPFKCIYSLLLSLSILYFSCREEGTHNAGKRYLLKNNFWGGCWKRKLEKGGTLQENKKIVPLSVGCGGECMT